MSQLRLIFCTAPAEAASALAEALVGEGAIACANLVEGAASIYRWQGEVVRERETLMFMETHADALEETLRRIEALHPYEVPKILVFDPSAANATYEAWVAEIVAARSEPT